MDFDSRARAVLERAERELAGLAAEAAAGRAYRDAQRLLGLVERLAAFSGASSPAVEHPDSAISPRSSFERAPAGRSLETADCDARGDSGPKPSGPSNPRPLRPKKRLVGSREYPQFRRGPDESLVKIGYSKSDRRQYEHRSPRNVLDQLVEELDAIGTNGRLFSTEGLIGEGSARLSDHPTYQVYLCLAFLVHHGLLVKMGRQGYTIATSARANFRDAVREAFALLPA